MKSLFSVVHSRLQTMLKFAMCSNKEMNLILHWKLKFITQTNVSFYANIPYFEQYYKILAEFALKIMMCLIIKNFFEKIFQRLFFML